MSSRAAGALALMAALALSGWSARADVVTLCYNYGCSAAAPVEYSEAQLSPLRQALAAAGDAQAERRAMAIAIGRMYAIAGEQTPVWRDKGGNYADQGDNGRMDCIDHATNTSAFLRLLHARGWLRFHEVLEPLMRRRFFFAVHWGAHLRELESREDYVVDSWFFDNGHPAGVYALGDWLAGKTPSVH